MRTRVELQHVVLNGYEGIWESSHMDRICNFHATRKVRARGSLLHRLLVT